MKKIEQGDMRRLTGAASTIGELFEQLETARDKANEELAEIVGLINEARETVREILEDSANVAEEYRDERSDAWQEGERGQAYNEWAENMRQLADDAAEEIEAPEIPEVDRPAWLIEVDNGDFAEFNFEG